MPQTSRSRHPAKPRRPARPARYSRTQPPADLGTAEWQAALRRQFGREQAFELKNVGGEPVFSEFQVYNPASGRRYRVAIRGRAPGENFCSCPDFATNDLGTCKHIEFVLGRLERRRGGKAALRRGFEPDYSEVWLRYGAERDVYFRAGRRCTPALLKRARALFDPQADWKLPRERFHRLGPFLAAAKRSRHEVRCYDDALAFVHELGEDVSRRYLLDEHFAAGAAAPDLRDLLDVPLYRYQCEGAWFAARAGRAIIADDMGLGKTVQAIAAAELLMRVGKVMRVLVVCPTSLKQQWVDEIHRMTSRPAMIIGGPQRERARQFSRPGIFKVTNYDTVRRDLDLINAWSPDLVIADEAQRIKNWETKAAQALKQVRSRHALVLTGTPLENRLTELVSIVQFVDQHRLGPTWRFLETHQIHSETGQVVGYRRLDEIAETLAPILIRRRKAEVLDQLPPRRDKLFLLPLTRPQRALHEEQAEIVARIVSRWKKQRYLSDKDQKRLMAALQTMRMVCDSTYLVSSEEDHGRKIPEVTRVLDELLTDPELKVVIFSQWLRSHELLQRALEAAGHDHALFHGSIPAHRRAKVVERFRTDPACRVLLATDAGGVGLNLQCASVVINLDLPWNPAVLEQRIGRVHRLGQHRLVQVMNFVAEESIESGILGLLEFKRSLADGVLDGGEQEIHLGGTRLKAFMERVEQATADTSATAAEPAAPVLSVADSQIRDASNLPPQGRKVGPPAASPTEQGRGIGGTGNPWLPLLDLGQQLLAEMTQAEAGDTGLVRRDPESGEAYLHLPMPEPASVQRVADAIRELVGQSRR